MTTFGRFNHLNGDRWLWTDDNPDVELIEPRVLVSVDKNWLVFGHAKVKPALKHTITLTNHADHPVAFKIHTSDNFAYFVNQETGLIPGKRLFGLPFVKTNNQVQIDIYRRPFMYFSRRYPEQIQHCKAPRKDRCFIYIAPVFGWNTEPASVFTHDIPFEKLRICLDYTASKLPPSSTTTFLFEYRYGWNTWQTREEVAQARHKMTKEQQEAHQKQKDEKFKTTYIKPKDPKKIAAGAKQNAAGLENKEAAASNANASQGVGTPTAATAEGSDKTPEEKTA